MYYIKVLQIIVPVLLVGRLSSKHQLTLLKLMFKLSFKNAIKAGLKEIALQSIMEEMSSKKLSTSQAIERLLQEDFKTDEVKLKKLRKSLDESFELGGNAGLAPALTSLLEWKGLENKQEKKQGIASANKFPVFYTAFQAAKSYSDENSDLFDIRELASALELLTKLARKMWVADPRVTDALSMTLNKELIEKGDTEVQPGMSDAALLSTLGLKRPFEDMARAALEIPNEEMKHLSLVFP